MNSFYAVKKIYLMMGSACNLKCRHCYQTDAELPKPKKRIHADVWKFLHDISDAKDDRIELVFWGGEPLLYFDLIRSVVTCFGNRFDYGLISNGTLLTDEMVQFFNHHDVLFSVSCDGPLTEKVRGVNILEDDAFCRRFRQIRRRCVGATTHAYNIDPHALINYVKRRVGEVNIHYQYTLECTFDMDRDLYNYDFYRFRENLRKCRKEFIDDAVSGRQNTIAQFVLKRGVRGVMDYMSRKKKGVPPKWWSECSSMRKTMNIDILGFVHICHNMSSIIGRVTDSYEDLLEENDRQLRAAMAKKPECKTCEVNFLCRHGCPLNPITPAQKICCEAEKAYWIQSLLTVEDAAKITGSSFDLGKTSRVP